MSNISISEIQATNEYLKNDDLLLCSVKDHSNNTYQSAKISGMNLKTSISMPPVRNLRQFKYQEITTREIHTETMVTADNTTVYSAYYTLTIPVSSYCHVWGNFVVTKNCYDNHGGIIDQWLAIRILVNNNPSYITLTTNTSGYQDSTNNISYGVQLSFWQGFAEAGTEFILYNNHYFRSQDRQTFIDGLIDDPINRLQLSYWTPNQN